eukprot:m.478399 g.478399  ORF g.478399 m.478399 type:complete len:897 (-) comp21140_c0_seq1:156-2846(-)
MSDTAKMDTTPDGVDKAKEPKKEEKKNKEEEVELSEEDQALKDDLEMMVARLEDPDASLHKPALESLRTHIRAATSSMTSVPKPLRFLRPHYDAIQKAYERFEDPETKAFASDVASLLAMTYENDDRHCLKYCLTGTRNEAIGSWGSEYVRHVQAELAEEHKLRTDAEPPQPIDDLIKLAEEIVPFTMAHNAEADACDLLMEIDRMDMLEAHVDSKAYERVCLYLLSCVPYVPEPDDANLLRTCLSIFRKFEQWPQSLLMALKLNEPELVRKVFFDCKDKQVKRQLAFMLGRQQVMIDLNEEMPDGEEEDEEETEILMSLIANTRLNKSFEALARELDIMEAKTPDDIYKTHLESSQRSSTVHIDSARANLASTFVNAFVNAGFSQDKLVMGSDGQMGGKWIYKNKDHGMLSAAASLGMLLLWNVEGGLNEIEKYMYVSSDFIKAGALLAIGVVNSGVHDECDPAFALLSEYPMHDNMMFRSMANMGLGLAKAGSANEDVKELLLPALEDPQSTIEVLGATALALGQIFVGTCDGDITEAIVSVIMSKLESEDLKSTHARFLALGLGLLYLNKQQQAEVTLATLATVPGTFGKIAAVLVETCAYAGTGNVLKVQNLLHACSEHIDTDAEGAETDNAHQAFAVLGIAMVAMGEDIGADMALRTMRHLLQYGEPVIRRAVPVAMALLCASNPLLNVLDILSKLSHDPDAEVAYSSIFAMGLVGAGTNHARIAGMLRHLAQYYHKDPNALFVVRIAQGLLHTGKGSITMSPFHTDRSLMSPVAVSGLLAVLVSVLDIQNVLLKSSHFMLYHLSLAMWPRILCTFDESLESVVTSVRVGQAVDVVGQAGKPKTITGFVTNTTPVLLGHGERAQLATEEYLPLTPLLEGFVIIKKNPEWEA